MIWRGYLRTSSEVSSGNNEKNPDSMALVRVESVGKHSAPCRNAIKSVIVVYGVVLITVGMVCRMA